MHLQRSASFFLLEQMLEISEDALHSELDAQEFCCSMPVPSASHKPRPYVAALLFLKENRILEFKCRPLAEGTLHCSTHTAPETLGAYLRLKSL